MSVRLEERLLLGRGLAEAALAGLRERSVNGGTNECSGKGRDPARFRAAPRCRVTSPAGRPPPPRQRPTGRCVAAGLDVESGRASRSGTAVRPDADLEAPVGALSAA